MHDLSLYHNPFAPQPICTTTHLHHNPFAPQPICTRKTSFSATFLILCKFVVDVNVPRYLASQIAQRHQTVIYVSCTQLWVKHFLSKWSREMMASQSNAQHFWSRHKSCCQGRNNNKNNNSSSSMELSALVVGAIHLNNFYLQLVHIPVPKNDYICKPFVSRKSGLPAAEQTSTKK